MSNRECNYCLLKRWRKEVQKTKAKIDLKPDEKMGGVNVYENGKFIAWFAALPDSCAC